MLDWHIICLPEQAVGWFHLRVGLGLAARIDLPNFSCIQLEKSTQIQSLDIGNDGSAFVEVLVGRSTAPESYEVILGMSTFMSPPESKQWNNTNRVRIFGELSYTRPVIKQCVHACVLHACACIHVFRSLQYH